MNIVLSPSFFARSPLTVAPDLLGKYLVRRIDGRDIALMINEVEVYDGPDDLACHARVGKTPRTAPMFGPPGHFYIYFVYGIHWMLNIVVEKDGYPAALLIRGAGEIAGPARLTKYLHITKDLNTKEISKETGLWCEDRGIEVNKDTITKTPRIGVSYAGPIWAEKPYRFILTS